MNEDKKLAKLLDKMTDDAEKNKKLIKKNKELIDFINNKSCILNRIMYNRDTEDKIIKFIQAYFSSITIYGKASFYEVLGIKNVNNRKTNNGTFLHRAISSHYSISFIRKLLKVIDEFTNNGTTKHNEYVYELINIRNRYNEHFLHYYFEHVDLFFKENIRKDYDDLCYLISEYNMEFGFKTYNIMVRLDRLNNEGERILSNEQLINLKQLIFKNSLSSLFLDHRKSEKEKIVDLFGDINYWDSDGSLLHWCFTHHISHFVPDEKNATEHILDRMKNLLEYGVDPNLVNSNGESFIEIAIKAAKSSGQLLVLNPYNEQLKQILIESIKYGFDIKKHPKLFETYLKSLDNIGDAMEVYNLLCQNGYQSYGFDNVDENYIRLHAPLLSIDFRYVNFRNLFVFNSNCEHLISNLIVKGLTVEEDFIKKYRDICCHYGERDQYMGEPLIIEFNDILNDIQKFINIDSIEEFMDLWTECIINQRREGVNLDDNPITVCETISALNYMIIDKVSNKEDKIKLLTYISNIRK